MKFLSLSPDVKGHAYESDSGATESFFVLEVSPDLATTDALSQLDIDLQGVLSACGCDERTIVFSRFYCSDLANQRDDLLASSVYQRCKGGACSVIEQSPLSGSRVLLLVYLVAGATVERLSIDFGDGWSRGAGVQGEYYTHYWTGNFVSDVCFSSYQQTEEIFDRYQLFLTQQGMTLFDHAVRTWIYVRDIDNHYAGMVAARKGRFELNGMIPKTHFVASTGIEARLRCPANLVSMDTLSIKGIQPEQVVQMRALEHLNPTHEYGVTFERGTRISFGDRDHFHISGTASIDKHGAIMHVGDVEQQTRRTLKNIRALLAPHGGTLDDMAFLIVYLRDYSHVNEVTQLLRDEVGHDVPVVAVRGAVCRPRWLVEIEGIGIKRSQSSFPPFA